MFPKKKSSIVRRLLVFNSGRFGIGESQLGDVAFKMMVMKCLTDGLLAFFFIKEEHLILFFLFVRRGGHVYRLHGFGINAGVVHLGAECHRGGREILYLFEALAQMFHFHGQIGHIFKLTARMRADEIGYQLIIDSCLPTDGIEALFSLQEEVELGLAHIG